MSEVDLGRLKRRYAARASISPHHVRTVTPLSSQNAGRILENETLTKASEYQGLTGTTTVKTEDFSIDEDGQEDILFSQDFEIVKHNEDLVQFDKEYAVFDNGTYVIDVIQDINRNVLYRHEATIQQVTVSYGDKEQGVFKAVKSTTVQHGSNDTARIYTHTLDFSNIPHSAMVISVRGTHHAAFYIQIKRKYPRHCRQLALKVGKEYRQSIRVKCSTPGFYAISVAMNEDFSSVMQDGTADESLIRTKEPVYVDAIVSINNRMMLYATQISEKWVSNGFVVTNESIITITLVLTSKGKPAYNCSLVQLAPYASNFRFAIEREYDLFFQHATRTMFWANKTKDLALAKSIYNDVIGKFGENWNRNDPYNERIQRMMKQARKLKDRIQLFRQVEKESAEALRNPNLALALEVLSGHISKIAKEPDFKNLLDTVKGYHVQVETTHNVMTRVYDLFEKKFGRENAVSDEDLQQMSNILSRISNFSSIKKRFSSLFVIHMWYHTTVSILNIQREKNAKEQDPLLSFVDDDWYANSNIDTVVDIMLDAILRHKSLDDMIERNLAYCRMIWSLFINDRLPDIQNRLLDRKHECTDALEVTRIESILSSHYYLAFKMDTVRAEKESIESGIMNYILNPIDEKIQQLNQLNISSESHINQISELIKNGKFQELKNKLQEVKDLIPQQDWIRANKIAEMSKTTTKLKNASSMLTEEEAKSLGIPKINIERTMSNRAQKPKLSFEEIISPTTSPRSAENISPRSIFAIKKVVVLRFRGSKRIPPLNHREIEFNQIVHKIKLTCQELLGYFQHTREKFPNRADISEYADERSPESAIGSYIRRRFLPAFIALFYESFKSDQHDLWSFIQACAQDIPDSKTLAQKISDRVLEKDLAIQELENLSLTKFRIFWSQCITTNQFSMFLKHAMTSKYVEMFYERTCMFHNMAIRKKILKYTIIFTKLPFKLSSAVLLNEYDPAYSRINKVKT
jgi:hypothetical protein